MCTAYCDTVNAYKCIISSSGKQECDGKLQTFGKRCQAAKRDPNCPVVIRGWLNKKVILLAYLTMSSSLHVEERVANLKQRAAPNQSSSCRTALVWSYGREGGSSSPTTVCFTIKVKQLVAQHFVWMKPFHVLWLYNNASLLLFTSFMSHNRQ